jgi:hypothetical protein
VSEILIFNVFKDVIGYFFWNNEERRWVASLAFRNGSQAQG